MLQSRSFVPLIEILVMIMLLLSFIWLWKGSFKGDFLLLLFLYFGIGISSHIRSRENASIIGIRFDNWLPAFRNALWVAIPFIVAALLFGSILRSYHYPTWYRSLGSLGWEWIWGTAQQYGLLCFFYRRLSELLHSKRGVMLIAGLLFALFHLPNLFLLPVTFLAGTLSCWLYSREPNLPILGAMHALISFAIANSLPIALTNNMQVGP